MSDNFTFNEVDRFENLLLDWIRTVAIFLVVGIALYHFTSYGKVFALTSFLITIVLVTTLIVDYILRRQEITSKGHEVRLALDILAASMMPALAKADPTSSCGRCAPRKQPTTGLLLLWMRSISRASTRLLGGL